MPRGLGKIPDLRLEVLQGFVTKFTTPPNLLLSNLFPSTKSPSSTIKWESQTGGRDMTPFVPPGSPAPKTAPKGIAKHSAEAAFWKEKMYFDEEFLNNIRKEGTEGDYLDAQQRLAKELTGLTNRSNRRKEWMFAKMITAGSFSYDQTSGYKATVDYELLSDHKVTLGADYKWDTGGSKNILKDVIAGKKKVSDETGAKVDFAIMNNTVLEDLVQDPAIQTLLQKSAFGAGNLFEGNLHDIVGANPGIIGGLLDIPNFIVYDEQYEVRAILTAAVTADSTTVVSVDDVTDFEVGSTLRFHDVSADTYEDETIASIQVEAGTVTVSTAPSTAYKAGEDFVSMRRYFIPDETFVMFASQVEGQKIAEYKPAPFALDRHYGIKTDTHEEWDPEGIYIRVQDKGLPVLYFRDAVYILTVN